MTQETFAALGVVFTGLLVIGLAAIGIGALVATLKEWLQDKRWSTKNMLETQKSMLETQRALMEANNRLNERVTAIEDELRGDAK